MVEEGPVVCLGLAKRHAIRCQAAEGVSLTLLVLLLRSVLVLLDVQDVGGYEQRCLVLSGLRRVLDAGIEAFLIPALYTR